MNESEIEYVKKDINYPIHEAYKNLSLEDMEGEIWKPAFGIEKWYEVSNYGRLKRLPRESNFIRKKKKGGFYNRAYESKYKIHGYKILKTSISKKGYVRIKTLYQKDELSNSKDISITLHRLVAKTFIPNPDNLDQINHINGIKHDNRIENLEWCNNSQNQRHAIDVLGKQINESFKLLIESQKVKIVKLNKNYDFIKLYDSISDAERDNEKCYVNNISKVCQNKRNFCGGYKWIYYEDYINNKTINNQISIFQ